MDYRNTVFLPRTDFPMKGELPKREPALLARWREIDLYRRQREMSAGRPKFVLHDGPPYANGHLHMGHALNKVLKDVINRGRQMTGHDAVYVPGWDCHGLPIEWKIEERYRAAGQDKDAVPIAQFRRECRDFAAEWIEIQKGEFERLGVLGDWAHPYTTMAYAAEAQIARELGKFLMNGGLYRGAKPVMWSTVEKTALAEAEVEYHDHTSTTIWVRFPVVTTSAPALAGADVVIWTTTPWTMPGNRAVAYGAEFPYAVVEVTAVADGSLARPGDRLVLAEPLVADVLAKARVTGHEVVAVLAGSALAGTVLAHPLAAHPGAAGGYDHAVPLLEAPFVTIDQGTGFVHMAPGHGPEDFEVGLAHGLEIPPTLDDAGVMLAHVPLFAGRRVYSETGKAGDADAAVVAALTDTGRLLARGKLTHSYPHSWRSKAPLLYRTTPQWFIGMEQNGLRQTALAAIDATRFVPPQGRNRLRAMIEQRPDWCVSRQRSWGVPITVFTNRRTGEPLRDAAVVDRIAAAFESEGADAWFTGDSARFLGNGYDPAEWEKVTDILDVWFDSGSTHSFVLEQRRPDLAWPASLYLEGSDQHRGWFHSSLLEACGTRGRAPYDAVLTHGFVLDEAGRKMSKSLGNIVAPEDIIAKSGADILRLWVVASDYSEDLRIGPEILKYQSDVYRRLRNTLRYLLGNLAGYDAAEQVEASQMPELERWVLHRLTELDREMRTAAESFDYHGAFTALHGFCAVDLSAFYFDIRKDALYCDRPDDPVRRAARTVLDQVFRCLVTWLAPVLCFTAEEAWLARFGDAPDVSVHLEQFPVLPAGWHDAELGEKWQTVREIRRVVTGAIELQRAAKTIGSSLQAEATVHGGQIHLDALDGLDLAEIAIVSAARLSLEAPPDAAFTLPDVAGIAAVIVPAAGEKCQRCWKVLPEVSENAGHGHGALCRRCDDAVVHARVEAA